MLATDFFGKETIAETLHRFNDWYETFCHITEKEPTVINVHEVRRNKGTTGDFEWKADSFNPVENVCIFSKEQAIRELLRLHAYYQEESCSKTCYSIMFSRHWGEQYVGPNKQP
jgi:hypothetical protein